MIMIRDLRYSLHKLFDSSTLVLAVVFAVTMGAITMGLAVPHIRQGLLNVRLAIRLIDSMRLQAQRQGTPMNKKSSADQVEADNTQDQVEAQTDEDPYGLGATARFGHLQARDVTGRSPQQPQPSRNAAGGTLKQILAGQVVQVDPSLSNTHRTRTIGVELDGAAPPKEIRQPSISVALDMKRLLSAVYTGVSVSANQDSTLNFFKVDADGKPAPHIAFKAGRSLANKSQDPHRWQGRGRTEGEGKEAVEVE